jgi:hypothetical protein
VPPYLSIPHYHLSKLPVTTKVALTGFALSLASAVLFVGAAVYAERTGYETRRVQANFAGDERVTKETGHRFDQMHAEPSRRAIYDIVHPHSFMMPLIFFVLTHMMEMSYAPRAAKLGLYVGSFLAMMLTIFAPLLVWTKISLAVVVTPAVGALMIAFLIMSVVPVWQMWFCGDRPKEAKASHGA